MTKISTVATSPIRPSRFIEPEFSFENTADGSIVIRGNIKAECHFLHLPHLLEVRAQQIPERPILAQRQDDSSWRSISYSEYEESTNRVASFLLDAGYGPETPLMILSENSIEHAVMMLAAMKARIPLAPISVAYSLMDKQFNKLRKVAEVTRPALVFADDPAKFSDAYNAIRTQETVFVSCGVAATAMGQLDYDQLVRSPLSDKLKGSLNAIDDDTPAKYMFTSGSTGSPKAVVHTHGMLRAGLASVDAVRRTDHASEDYPVSLGWMPWSHVSAGNMSFLENMLEGGTLFLDDGKPVVGQFDKTLANITDVSPTLYGSAPVAYAWLADAMEEDESLRSAFFNNMQSMIYGGAALVRSVYDRIQALSVLETGYRVPFMSVYGSTEAQGVTLTYQENVEGTMIGMPVPGITVKLTPVSDKYEVRVKGGTVFKEYLGEPELTASSFDEEGYFCMGDAARFADKNNPSLGMVFDGRISEEFKLNSGTWVSAGNIRLNVLSATNEILSDVVVCGENRNYLSILAWLNMPVARKALERDAEAGASEVRILNGDELIQSAKLRDLLDRLIRKHNEHFPGSSTRIARLLLLDKPPSLADQEINEKGYVNQRKVIANHSLDVDLLYQEVLSDRVIDFR